MHWRDEWDQAATAETSRYDALPVASLLEDVRAGRLGDYHTIWYAIAARSTLAESGAVLLEVLESAAPYLVRYHAAAALLRLLGERGVEPVELSAARFPLAENLARLRAEVARRIGAPRDAG